MSKLKQIAYWTVPIGHEDNLRALRAAWNHKLRLSSEEKLILRKNQELHNCHYGKRCFILATGPSIKQQDLKFLQGEICIALSNFFVHPDYALIKPRYYCIAPYHPPITEEAWQSWMDELESGCGNTQFFFGLRDRKRNQHNGRFVSKKLRYLNLTGAWRPLLKKGIDLAQPVPSPQSVSIMALLISIYMGFEEIYLLGCDHDWILHLNESSHFYNEKKHALNQKGYNEWFGNDLEYYCQSYVNLWRAYKRVYAIAQDNSIKIYNATPGGLLDIFPRVNYENIFT